MFSSSLKLKYFEPYEFNTLWTFQVPVRTILNYSCSPLKELDFNFPMQIAVKHRSTDWNTQHS